MVNRRELMQAATVLPVAVVSGGATGALATCSSTGGIQIDPNILVAINNAVIQSCNWIPAITTVIPLINAAFASLIGATTIAESVLAQIAGLLCKSAPTATAAGKFEAKAPLKAGDVEIPVHGWVVENGHFTYV